MGGVVDPPDAATFASAIPSDTEPEPGVEFAEKRRPNRWGVSSDGDVAPPLATNEMTVEFAAFTVGPAGGVSVVEADDVPTTPVAATTGVAELPLVRP